MNSDTWINLQYCIDDSYDYAGLLGFLLHLAVFRWFKRKLKNPFSSNKASFCSEVMCRAMQYENIRASKGYVPDLTSPEDLLKLMKDPKTGFKRVSFPWIGAQERNTDGRQCF